MDARRGRGRLNAFELLPSEADAIIAHANARLLDREAQQIEIYVEFYDACQRLMAESHGELSFVIPSKSAFNRYSVRLATMTRRIEDTREIAGAISERFDAAASDDLTLIAAEAIKTLIFELLTSAGEGGIDPKGAVNLANALHKAAQAQNVSTTRRQTVQAEFAAQAKQAVGAVAKAKGISDETAQDILGRLLGVEVKK